MTRDERMAAIEKARKASEGLQSGSWSPVAWNLNDCAAGLIEALEDAQAELDKLPSASADSTAKLWDLVARAERSLHCGPYGPHSGLGKELLYGLKDALHRAAELERERDAVIGQFPDGEETAVFLSAARPGWWSRKGAAYAGPFPDKVKAVRVHCGLDPAPAEGGRG